MPKVFFDASIIVAALISEKGGSHKLLRYAGERKIFAVTSQTVINEVKANLHKFKGVSENNLSNLIKSSKIIIRKRVTKNEISSFIGVVDEKDAHVLAGGVLTGCEYLVTLDKKHFLNKKVVEKVKNIKILSPKTLLQLKRL